MWVLLLNTLIEHRGYHGMSVWLDVGNRMGLKPTGGERWRRTCSNSLKADQFQNTFEYLRFSPFFCSLLDCDFCKIPIGEGYKVIKIVLRWVKSSLEKWDVRLQPKRGETGSNIRRRGFFGGPGEALLVFTSHLEGVFWVTCWKRNPQLHGKEKDRVRGRRGWTYVE